MNPFINIVEELKKSKNKGAEMFALRKQFQGKLFGYKDSILALTPKQQEDGLALVTKEIGLYPEVVQKAFDWTVMGKREQQAAPVALNFENIARKTESRKNFYTQEDLGKQVYAELASHKEAFINLSEEQKAAGLKLIHEKSGLPMERLEGIQMSLEGKTQQRKLDFDLVAKKLHSFYLTATEQIAKDPDLQIDINRNLYGKFKGYINKYKASLPLLSPEEISKGVELISKHTGLDPASLQFTIEHSTLNLDKIADDLAKQVQKFQDGKGVVKPETQLQPDGNGHLVAVETGRLTIGGVVLNKDGKPNILEQLQAKILNDTMRPQLENLSIEAKTKGIDKIARVLETIEVDRKAVETLIYPEHLNTQALVETMARKSEYASENSLHSEFGRIVREKVDQVASMTDGDRATLVENLVDATQGKLNSVKLTDIIENAINNYKNPEQVQGRMQPELTLEYAAQKVIKQVAIIKADTRLDVPSMERRVGVAIGQYNRDLSTLMRGTEAKSITDKAIEQVHTEISAATGWSKSNLDMNYNRIKTDLAITSGALIPTEIPFVPQAYSETKLLARIEEVAARRDREGNPLPIGEKYRNAAGILNSVGKDLPHIHPAERAGLALNIAKTLNLQVEKVEGLVNTAMEHRNPKEVLEAAAAKWISQDATIVASKKHKDALSQ